MSRFVLFLLIIALMTGGCAHTKNDSARTKTQGTAVGAGAGAVIGGIIGYAIGGRSGAAWGAGIGAAAGGVAGYTYGAHAAQKKQEYAGKEDWIDSYIADLETENVGLKNYNRALAQEIVIFDERIASLDATQKDMGRQEETLLSEKRALDLKHGEVRDSLQKAKQELQGQEAILAEFRAAKDAKSAEKLDARIQELKTIITEMEQHYEQLAMLSRQVVI